MSSGGGLGPEIKVLDLDMNKYFLARLVLNRRIIFDWSLQKSMMLY